jgi:hypothetical protein
MCYSGGLLRNALFSIHANYLTKKDKPLPRHNEEWVRLRDQRNASQSKARAWFNEG